MMKKNQMHNSLIAFCTLAFIVTLLLFLNLPQNGEKLEFERVVLKDDHKQVCTADECYSKVFEPMNEFKPIKLGQILPDGLHVIEDPSTGVKSAKKKKSTQKSNSNTSSTTTTTSTYDNDNNNKVEICDYKGVGKCYPKYFEPETEFKEVYPGQILPAGLHITMDVQTGKKMAKLVSEVSQPTGRKKSSPSDPLPTDRLVKLLDGFVDNSDDYILSSLSTLEELVHQMSWADKFVATPNAVMTLINLLSHSNPAIRAKSAIVLGSTVQNNYKAQVKVFESNILEVLYIRMEDEKSSNALKQVVYALGSELRGFIYGSGEFLKSGGLLRLLQLSNRKDLSDIVEKKVFVVLEDLLNPDMYGSNSGDDTESGYKNLLFDTSQLEKWCVSINELLKGKRSEHEASTHHDLEAYKLASRLVDISPSCMSLRESMTTGFSGRFSPMSV